ncbi:hypothetical protein [Pseudomarimonas arenosa]|uniref:Helix-turn-helix protein n=1 Tax=Pseudomarimonas arenosa TaxID=2774145 RepID=A0AAW3ZPP1_9GAMM|nr:hypothetical protein [Pseudomarimonas arenosa]MBD8527923.1 hypothetical protein [Pseudomarimonas arenosa]
MPTPERNRAKVTGRGKLPPFAAIPRHILESPEFGSLSGNAVKLLVELLGQFRGGNNGDLQLAWRFMSNRGWKSKGTLHSAKSELIEHGWLICTRQGGKHRPSLFAISWLPIDECKGKHDVLPESTASNLWKKTQTQVAIRANQPAIRANRH